MWSPPSITISLSSPVVSGYLYCICLAKAYRGWSNDTTAACPGLRCSTAFITTVMACWTMAIEWAASAKRGSNELWHRALTCFCRFPWKADHDTIAVVFLLWAFPFPTRLATVGCINSLSFCWWSSTCCLIWLSPSVSFTVVRDSASSSPFTLYCILGTLKPPCFWLDKGRILM